MNAGPVGVGLAEAGGGQGLAEYLFVRRAVAVLAREAVDEPSVIDRTAQMRGERADISRVRRSVDHQARETKSHDARDDARNPLCPSHAAPPDQPENG
jgi:hypothetical protein